MIVPISVAFDLLAHNVLQHWFFQRTLVAVARRFFAHQGPVTSKEKEKDTAATIRSKSRRAVSSSLSAPGLPRDCILRILLSVGFIVGFMTLRLYIQVIRSR